MSEDDRTKAPAPPPPPPDSRNGTAPIAVGSTTQPLDPRPTPRMMPAAPPSPPSVPLAPRQGASPTASPATAPPAAPFVPAQGGPPAAPSHYGAPPRPYPAAPPPPPSYPTLPMGQPQVSPPGMPPAPASYPALLGQPAGSPAVASQANPGRTAAPHLQGAQRPPIGAPNRAPPAPPPSGPDATSTGNFRIPAPPPSQRVPAPPPTVGVQFPQPGTTLVSPRGSYLVRRLLGGGEFGAVYECVGPFDQIYAVKMIRPANRPYDDVQKEWALEAKRLLSLRHPNVVYIHDAFEQGHLFYLALERCDHPLTAMLGTPMREGLVIELARQLLAAVQFLHDSDIVHDDLHPGNVLITHTDRPMVKISDFGISHELGGAPAIRPNVVHHKIMAPEVLASGYTSKQSDLYQVGLLLYWMLTGEPAIPPGLPYQELAHVVASGAPRQRAEQIGTPLGELIAKLLRRRESYRYTSPRDAWNELRELPAWQNRELFPAK